MRAPFAPPRLSRASERCRRRPGGCDQLGDRQARGEDLGLEVADVLRVDQRVIDRRHGILPDQFLCRDERAEIADLRAHVAMGQLEPGPGERVGELVRVLVEPPRDLLVDRVEPQGEVGGQHGGQAPLGRVVHIRDRRGRVLRLPLMRPGRALGQFPLVAEQVLEEVVAPPGRRRGPGDLQAAADLVAAHAGAEAALPAEALLREAAGLRHRAHMRRVASTMGLAEAVAAGDQRHGLLVVHRHAREGLADVARRRERIRLAVRPFRIDVDQAHLHGGQRILQDPVARVALVAEPGVLRPPVDVLFGSQMSARPPPKPKVLNPIELQRDVAGEDHQVGPGDLLAVLLLDRPQQPARLVEVDVVRPAVERREALRAVAGAAAAVADAVGAGAVPRHPDEQPPVVAEVGRPPLLRVGHQRVEVLPHGLQVELLELLGVVELLAHRIGQGGVLVENPEVQLVRPPVPIRPSPQ